MQRIKIDTSILKQASAGATYPSEDNKDTTITNDDKAKKPVKVTSDVQSFNGGETVIPPTGRTATFQRLRIDPNKTILWKGNPRNQVENNVSSLSDLILNTNGNVIPVFARPTGDSEYPYEIIYGSRRRQACIEKNKLLLVDVVVVTDEEADALAYLENEGRLDVHKLGMARYFKYRYELLKEEDPTITVSSFGSRYGYSRQTMHEYFTICNIPKVLDRVVKSGDWTFNKCLKLASYFDGKDALKEQAVLNELHNTYQVLADLLRDVKKEFSKVGENKPEKTLTEFITNNGAGLSRIVHPSGRVELKVSKEAWTKVGLEIEAILNKHLQIQQ